jgi:hypothetical protein
MRQDCHHFNGSRAAPICEQSEFMAVTRYSVVDYALAGAMIGFSEVHPGET